MRKYRFSRAIIFQYKDRIYDSVLMRENTGGENSYSGIFNAVF